MDTLSIITIITVTVFSLVIFVVLLRANLKGSFARKLRKKSFAKDSILRIMIDSIKLWELSNKGEIPTKQDDNEEIEQYANFINGKKYSFLGSMIEERR